MDPTVASVIFEIYAMKHSIELTAQSYMPIVLQRSSKRACMLQHAHKNKVLLQGILFE